jgi:hypothetical protein
MKITKENFHTKEATENFSIEYTRKFKDNVLSKEDAKKHLVKYGMFDKNGNSWNKDSPMNVVYHIQKNVMNNDVKRFCYLTPLPYLLSKGEGKH